MVFFGNPIVFAAKMNKSDLEIQKNTMITRHLKGRGITDIAVLKAMESVPREEFTTPEFRQMAYEDNPLPIGEGQTISQPYIVALMLQSLRLRPEDKALEVGAGSGYQAAVLAEIVDHVYTMEIIKTLADSAKERLEKLGYENVTVRHADGYNGWAEHAPYDKIIMAAAAEKIPTPLEDQLKEGGLLITPVGGGDCQELLLGEKRDGKVNYKVVTTVRFVPMTGTVLET